MDPGHQLGGGGREGVSVRDLPNACLLVQLALFSVLSFSAFVDRLGELGCKTRLWMSLGAFI